MRAFYGHQHRIFVRWPVRNYVCRRSSVERTNHDAVHGLRTLVHRTKWDARGRGREVSRPCFPSVRKRTILDFRGRGARVHGKRVWSRHEAVEHVSNHDVKELGRGRSPARRMTTTGRATCARRWSVRRWPSHSPRSDCCSDVAANRTAGTGHAASPAVNRHPDRRRGGRCS